MQIYKKQIQIYKTRFEKQLQHLIHTTLKHSSGALKLCQPHELFPQGLLMPCLHALQAERLISISHLHSSSHLGLNLCDDLIQEGCHLSHLLAQASSKAVNQPDAAGSLRCLLLNLPAAGDCIVRACCILYTYVIRYANVYSLDMCTSISVCMCMYMSMYMWLKPAGC